MDSQATQHAHVGMIAVKLHYTESLIRRAVKAFWWCATGPLYVLAVLLILVSFCFALARRSFVVGWGVRNGSRVAILLAVTVYVVHFRGSLARFRRMRTPEATIELGEERFRLSSDVGASEMPWSTITEIWRYPDYWLVFFSRAQFITLPAADLTADVREFILVKAKSGGATVT